MLILGIFGKFGAVFITIPEPVIGGMFLVMFGMIAAVGISNLQVKTPYYSPRFFSFNVCQSKGLDYFMANELPSCRQPRARRVRVHVSSSVAP